MLINNIVPFRVETFSNQYMQVLERSTLCRVFEHIRKRNYSLEKSLFNMTATLQIYYLHY